MERERTVRSTRSRKGREHPENMLERAYVFMGAPGSSTVTHKNLCDVTRHQLTYPLIHSVLGIPKPVVEYNCGEHMRDILGGTHGPSSSQNLLVFAFWPPALSSLHWEEGPAEGLCLSILGEVLH